MHLKSLKVFCDVIRLRSFSRAADENGISQSGTSQVVHQLEQGLGVTLIDRSKRPFVPTPEGETFYEGCRKLVEKYYALEEAVRTLHEEIAGRVKVASIYSVGLSHMNRFVRQFLGKYPKANAQVEYLHPDKVCEAVDNDQAALGLVSYARSSRTIKAIPWRQEPMVLVCWPNHPLADRVSVALEELNGLAVVGFDTDLRIRREIDRTLAARHVEVDVVMEFDNIETIKRAIEINVGVGLLPEPTVAREADAGSLVAVELAGDPLVRPLGIIQRRGRQLGRTAERFVQMLRDDVPLAPVDRAARQDPGESLDEENDRNGSAEQSAPTKHAAQSTKA